MLALERAQVPCLSTGNATMETVSVRPHRRMPQVTFAYSCASTLPMHYLGGKQAIDEACWRLAESQQKGAPAHMLIDLLDQAVHAGGALHGDKHKIVLTTCACKVPAAAGWVCHLLRLDTHSRGSIRQLACTSAWKSDRPCLVNSRPAHRLDLVPQAQLGEQRRRGSCWRQGHLDVDVIAVRCAGAGPAGPAHRRPQGHADDHN
jgi:hypothetical protein